MTAERDYSSDAFRRPLDYIDVARAARASRAWVPTYLARVGWTDALIVAASVVVAQVFRFGSVDPFEPNGAYRLPAAVVCIALILAWLAVLTGDVDQS